MSKIGRKVITFSNANVQISGNTITIGGTKAKFVHELPTALIATLDGKNLKISLRSGEKESKENKMLWGLHRALIANKIKGLETGFEQIMKIVGLGFKAQLAGKKMTFTLGYTHKIDLELPAEVTVDVDKTGQILTFKSHDKFLLGNICDRVRSFRVPEPYKGTGVMKADEIIVRKAGKTKASASA
jgi:large subunit ribosomal protein L6